MTLALKGNVQRADLAVAEPDVGLVGLLARRREAYLMGTRRKAGIEVPFAHDTSSSIESVASSSDFKNELTEMNVVNQRDGHVERSDRPSPRRSPRSA